MCAMNHFQVLAVSIKVKVCETRQVFSECAIITSQCWACAHSVSGSRMSQPPAHNAPHSALRTGRQRGTPRPSLASAWEAVGRACLEAALLPKKLSQSTREL
jgi:hypothetical protein